MYVYIYNELFIYLLWNIYLSMCISWFIELDKIEAGTRNE